MGNSGSANDLGAELTAQSPTRSSAQYYARNHLGTTILPGPVPTTTSPLVPAPIQGRTLKPNFEDIVQRVHRALKTLDDNGVAGQIGDV
jgi:hypothetical protein